MNDDEKARRSGGRTALILPALNEEQALGSVIRSLPKELIDRILVVDNGSTDETAKVAREAGAEVVFEPRRGYGQACLTGIDHLGDENLIVFMDADGSDDPADLGALLEPILEGRADFSIGSRALGTVEKGSMTPPQRFGNWLATTLIELLWGVRYHDLGPFRAVTREALEELKMSDRTYGWTVEMQIKAIERRIRTVEVPVNYRRRVGVSKISGTVRGVVGAGTKILFTIFRYRLSRSERKCPT